MTRRPALVLLLLPLLAACGGGTPDAPPGSRVIGMGNPASRYCAELGGRLEVQAEQGGEAAYCHLPDGSVMEEWELFRGKNSL